MRKLTFGTCFILMISMHIHVCAQEYQLIKSTISHAGSSTGNRHIFLSHTIGQTSLISAVQLEGIQFLQGFEHQLLTKYAKSETDNKAIAFPNPSVGPITIIRKAQISESLRLIIYDLKGAITKRLKYAAHDQYIKIDLSSLPKGYYQIRIESDRHSDENCHILIK